MNRGKHCGEYRESQNRAARNGFAENIVDPKGVIGPHGTARQAVDEGYQVAVLTDCCAIYSYFCKNNGFAADRDVVSARK